MDVCAQKGGHGQPSSEGKGAFPSKEGQKETYSFSLLARHGIPASLMCSWRVMTVFSRMGWALNKLLWDYEAFY